MQVVNKEDNDLYKEFSIDADKINIAYEIITLKIVY